MTESNVMKIVTSLLVLGVVWTLSSISTLKANGGAQEVHIQNGIETDRLIQSKQAALGERIARQESETNGINVTLAIVIKNQDRILEKLEDR